MKASQLASLLRETRPRWQAVEESQSCLDAHTWTTNEIQDRQQRSAQARQAHHERLARLVKNDARQDMFDFVNSWSIELAAEAGLRAPHLLEPAQSPYVFAPTTSNHHVFKHLAPYLPQAVESDDAAPSSPAYVEENAPVESPEAEEDELTGESIAGKDEAGSRIENAWEISSGDETVEPETPSESGDREDELDDDEAVARDSEGDRKDDRKDDIEVEHFGHLPGPDQDDALARLRRNLDAETATVLYDDLSDQTSASESELLVDEQDAARHRHARQEYVTADVDAAARAEEAYFDAEEATEGDDVEGSIYPPLDDLHAISGPSHLESFADFIAEESALDGEARPIGASVIDDAGSHRASSWAELDAFADNYISNALIEVPAPAAEPNELQAQAYDAESEASAAEEKDLHPVEADGIEVLADPGLAETRRSALDARSATSSKSALDAPSAYGIEDANGTEELPVADDPETMPVSLAKPTPSEAFAMLRQTARLAAEAGARDEMAVPEEPASVSVGDRETSAEVSAWPNEESALQVDEVLSDREADHDFLIEVATLSPRAASLAPSLSIETADEADVVEETSHEPAGEFQPRENEASIVGELEPADRACERQAIRIESPDASSESTDERETLAEEVLDRSTVPRSRSRSARAQAAKQLAEAPPYNYLPNAIAPGLWQPGEPIRFFGESTEAAIREAVYDPERRDHLVEVLSLNGNTQVLSHGELDLQVLSDGPDDEHELALSLIPVKSSSEVGEPQGSTKVSGSAPNISSPPMTRSRSRRLESQQPSDSAVSIEDEPARKRRKVSDRSEGSAEPTSFPRRSRRQRGQDPVEADDDESATISQALILPPRKSSIERPKKRQRPPDEAELPQAMPIGKKSGWLQRLWRK